MRFLKNATKILIILVTILLMALPFIAEFFTFRRDKKKKILYKRLRVLIYTVAYVIVVTIILYLIKEIFLWVESLSAIKWIVKKIALDYRIVYCGKVLAAVAINFAIGFVYRFIGKLVRIGLKKKNLVKPKKKNGEFNWRQKAERRVIKFFHTETWFFVGTIVKWLSITLSAAYALIFVAYQIPALFGADWVPYEFISMVFSAGYIYPTITLLVLWEMCFFLEGIKRIEDECPELLHERPVGTKSIEAVLEEIDEEIRKQFGDFYICDVDVSASVQEELVSTNHNPITEYIAQAVENDSRNPQTRKEVYMNCLDKLVESEKGILINGSFFSGFSMYFLRYISVIVARGDSIVFVCNSDSQIDAVYDYLIQGLTEISSLYCKGFENDAVNFDDPIWRVIKVSGEHSVIKEASVDEANVLVTSLGYLCSARFETEHSRLISLIDAVVFVDSLCTVNTYNRQLAIINTRLKHIVKKNSLEARNGKVSDMFRVRYMSRKIRYICFDDTRTPGLDKVMKNMLAVDFDTVDAMNYNSSTMVRCYNYEGRADANGRRSCTQFFNSEEEIGVVMNMAVLCLAKGAANVTVFADNIIPYGNIEETITSNMGQLSIKANGSNIRLNKRFYNPDDYSVIIAIDSGDNLPTTLRRYVSMVSNKPALIIVFSRPYMLRDYYVSNINKLWINAQIERIPVEEETNKDIAQSILVRANAGGISKDDVIRLATGVPQFAEYVAKRDLNAILRGVLQIYGGEQGDRFDLFKYFEYTSSHNFDDNGNYNSEVMVVLRRHGKIFDFINGRNEAIMVVGGDECILPVPATRLTQNYIAGQNLVYNGNTYYIEKVDVGAGKLYTRLAVGGKNDEAYRYIQAREYRLEVGNDKIEYSTTKHVVLGLSEGEISVSDVYVSAFRVPMEVVTNGYFEIDPHTLSPYSGTNEYHSINDPGNDALAKQTYRRYGNVTAPIYSTDSVIRTTDLNAAEKGAKVMAVRICGQLGSDINKTMSLASVMLNELIGSMFPSVADSIAVVPVLHGEYADDELQAVLDKQPKIKIIGESELISNEDFELLIIEDCETDLGVVSVLMSAGDDVLSVLFSPVFNYLKWYLVDDKKSDYLYFGLEHQPECFDFVSLHKLSKLLCDDEHDLKFVALDSVVESEVCDFCGRCYVKGCDVDELDDGRRMCKSCAGTLVGNNKKLLKAHLDRAKIFLSSTYGITFDNDYDFSFESTVKIENTLKQNRNLVRAGSDVPLKSYVGSRKKVHVEYSIPSVSLSELLVRELTHIWQLKNLPELSDDLVEGHIALVAVQYLRFLNQNALASVRSTYYESTVNLSGEGYRRLVRALLENVQFNNNPFSYLMQAVGRISEAISVPHAFAAVEYVDFGLSYVPKQPDRALDGNISYLYYSRLSPECRKIYDMLLDAVTKHEEKVVVGEYDFNAIEPIMESIEYDHPELFWYKTFSMCGSEVTLCYGASVEEAMLLQQRIDEVVPAYLQGIDSSMSAYDVALRVYVKVISSVDYDTVALNKQRHEGGPSIDRIDSLRTICGVFLDGKAVCEGYARAVQYLLQKCGIECAEVAGHIRKETGERDAAHAWNILKIDGDYYHLDVTWDDSSNTVQTVKVNDLSFDYFCVTTEELKRTRDIDLCPTDIPDCRATQGNYFYYNDYVLDTYDLYRIKAIAQISVRNGGRSFSIKCNSKALFDLALVRLCAEEQDCYEVLKSAAKVDKKILTNTYSYVYDKNIWTITVKFKYK